MNVLELENKPNRRLLVTSDIHGHASLLEDLLNRAGFGGDDLLVIVGDILDKGPESLRVVRRVMALCAEGRAIVLSGNVDNRVLLGMDELYRTRQYDGWTLDYLFSMRQWKGSSFFDDLCREATGRVPNTVEELLGSLDAVYARFEKELQFVRSLPTALKTDKYLFVHGGLPEGETAEGLVTDGRDPYPFLKLDHFLGDVRASGRVFDRYVVCGHWPVALYSEKIPCMNPLFDHQARVISIDGGCGIKRDGQLNMLIFPSADCEASEIQALCRDDLPTVIANTAQEDSADSFCIRWIDRGAKFLSLCGDTAEVEHLSSGRRMRVPAAFLDHVETLSAGDTANMHDCTDYRLPVEIGDTLSVIAATSHGLYAKKNGVSGWFFGKYCL